MKTDISPCSDELEKFPSTVDLLHGTTRLPCPRHLDAIVALLSERGAPFCDMAIRVLPAEALQSMTYNEDTGVRWPYHCSFRISNKAVSRLAASERWSKRHNHVLRFHRRCGGLFADFWYERITVVKINLSH